MNQVKYLAPAQAAARPVPQKKSMWKHLLNGLALRDFAIRKLRDEDEFEIELNTPLDFPPLPEVNVENWQSLLDQLHVSQQTLLRLVESFPQERWENAIPGRKYTYAYLLHGIVQHDCYHLGQIGMLKSLLKL